MQLESVRALKAELSESVIRPLVEQTQGLVTLGVAARSLDRTTRVRPGVALGVARGESGSDYKLAVRVQQRLLDNGAGLREQLAEAAGGEIDYRYVGRIAKRQIPWTQQRQRPLLIGCSVGHVAITAGTLGAFATSHADGRLLMLSNNHVLANEDLASIGDPIIQQGYFDGGSAPGDTVATLAGFVPLQTGGNLVDAAVAALVEDIGYDRSTLTGLGRLRGVRAAPIQAEDRVAKVGRTTVVTHGRVTAIELDNVVVEYEQGLLSFDNQIEIEGAGQDAFSAGGDSGSVIVDENGEACALLFAGGDVGGSNGKGLTYANEIGNVLDALDIDLAV
ncbi:MAG TPA: hypothetical protein VN231_08255 [Allosphingosinicella sp.]|nr:hypothetical protein [Allosphingosinicella sp.]